MQDGSAGDWNKLEASCQTESALALRDCGVQAPLANSIFLDLPPSALGSEHNLGRFMGQSSRWVQHCLLENQVIAGHREISALTGEDDDEAGTVGEEIEVASLDDESEDGQGNGAAQYLQVKEKLSFAIFSPGTRDRLECLYSLRIPLNVSGTHYWDDDGVRAIVAQELNGKMSFLAIFPFDDFCKSPCCLLALPMSHGVQQRITSSVMVKSSCGPYLLILGTSIGLVFMYEIASIKKSAAGANNIPLVSSPCFRSDHPSIISESPLLLGEIKSIVWNFDPHSFDLLESGRGFILDDTLAYCKYVSGRRIAW